jgi:hypothetical protein
VKLVSIVGFAGLASSSFFLDLVRDTLAAYDLELRFDIALRAAIWASLSN